MVLYSQAINYRKCVFLHTQSLVGLNQNMFECALSSLLLNVKSSLLVTTRSKIMAISCFYAAACLYGGGGYGILLTENQSPMACIGAKVAFICSATNTSIKILRLNVGGVEVLFYVNDSVPVRTLNYYTVTLLSSRPLTARAEATVALALNGSEVTCEEGTAYRLIGNGHIYVQGT